MDVGGVTPSQLKSFVERIETLEEEKRGAQDQVKEVFSEAKGEGFDVKILRQIIALRRQKPHERAEAEVMLSAYKAALGMD